MESALLPGCRVIVNFGSKRFYTGIVKDIHERCPQGDFEIKEIYSLLDEQPVLLSPQLKFWDWIAFYYMCKLGDVYKAAVPSGLKLESETVVLRNEDFEAEKPLRANEQRLLDLFQEAKPLTVAELEKRSGLRNVMPLVNSLMGRGALIVNEKLRSGYQPKQQSMVRLQNIYNSEEEINKLLPELHRAPRQEQLLIDYIDYSHLFKESSPKEVTKADLLGKSGSSAAVLAGLVKRGVLEVYQQSVNRLRGRVSELSAPQQLTDQQQQAFEEINEVFKTKEVCLLQGVTSSGKTEVYIHLIEEEMRRGNQVLYLLPEIAITTQITERLAKHFGDKLLVYHSKFSDNERVEVWNKLLHSREPMLVLGVRSSLFLPFSNLGLIIVDEEHETTYKQQDPAPRYHARNSAMVLASMHKGKVLLGSATPSLDSYFNAWTGKYGHVKLESRFGDVRMPEIVPVNIKELRRKKIMKDGLFSPLLLEKMNTALENGEQVILFQNRRGFAPVMECRQCGWVPHCINCDVSLTYHKFTNELTCHYCGFKMQLPPVCPACNSPEIRAMGFGTEKVEEEIKAVFPDIKTGRMDLDTAKTRVAYERIIDDFDKGNTQVLIGTQMLSKGLDFGNVGVVGILNADTLMNFPDFRAHEKAFQLMVQVSGRAGRRQKQGVVVLQTSNPEHPLIRMVQQFDFTSMANLQLNERAQFRYPPYFRLIEIILRGKDERMLHELSLIYAEKLRSSFNERVYGPVTPLITRVQNFHIRKIILKIETSANVQQVREILDFIYKDMQRYLPFKQLLVHYDVDPS